jgi:hypothetical protein
MDNLNELKSIWLSAKTDGLPGAEEMMRMVKGFRNQKLRSKWKVIGISMVSIIFWAGFTWYFRPVMVSTWVGAGLTVLSSFVLIWTNVRSMKRFYALNDCSNKEFLAFLEQTRRNQLYYHTKTQVLGMALSTLGLVLYLYEFLYRDIRAFIIGYSVALGLMLFIWLYIRPKSFNRQTIKLNATIEKLEKIANQIS